MTNLVFTLVLTNWLNVPTGDFKREDGTNSVKQYIASIETNVYEVVPVTVYRTNLLTSTRATFSPTNSVKAWRPQLPPLPGVQGRQ